MNQKPKWVKPEALVIVRKRPEERLLDSCKIDIEFGPNNANTGCRMDAFECLTPCVTDSYS
jgi:hypothetical protein